MGYNGPGSKVLLWCGYGFRILYISDLDVSTKLYMTTLFLRDNTFAHFIPLGISERIAIPTWDSVIAFCPCVDVFFFFRFFSLKTSYPHPAPGMKRELYYVWLTRDVVAAGSAPSHLHIWAALHSDEHAIPQTSCLLSVDVILHVVATYCVLNLYTRRLRATISSCVHISFVSSLRRLKRERLF